MSSTSNLSEENVKEHSNYVQFILYLEKQTSCGEKENVKIYSE